MNAKVFINLVSSSAALYCSTALSRELSSNSRFLVFHFCCVAAGTFLFRFFISSHNGTSSSAIASVDVSVDSITGLNMVV